MSPISTAKLDAKAGWRQIRLRVIVAEWTQEMQIASLLFASGATLAEHAPIVYALPIEFRLNDLASHALRVGSDDLPPNLEPNGAAQQAAYLNTSERRFACHRVR